MLNGPNRTGLQKGLTHDGDEGCDFGFLKVPRVVLLAPHLPEGQA